MFGHCDCTDEYCNRVVSRISADLAAEQAAGEGKFVMNIVLRRYAGQVGK
jgi:hypothetical protein